MIAPTSLEGPGNTWDILLAVAAGGALGSMLRWALGQVIGPAGDGWPSATFTVNLIGSFALGVLVVLLADRWAHRRLAQPFLAVGVLGGFTTFSTYALEARDLLAEGAPAVAVAYLGGSVLAALLALTLGGWVGQRLMAP